jgi:small subunit ribosomal protein S17
VEERRPGQTLTGVVVSDKMDKTVVVLVNRLVKHPVYKKYIKRRARFMAHDEKNVARLGDTVEIIQSRPLSKLKRWRLAKVLVSAA